MFRNPEWNTCHCPSRQQCSHMNPRPSEQLCLSKWGCGWSLMLSSNRPDLYPCLDTEMKIWLLSDTPFQQLAPRNFQGAGADNQHACPTIMIRLVKALCTPHCYWAFLSALYIGRMRIIYTDIRKHTFLKQFKRYMMADLLKNLFLRANRESITSEWYSKE